jgi:hypothetical protein
VSEVELVLVVIHDIRTLTLASKAAQRKINKWYILDALEN